MEKTEEGSDVHISVVCARKTKLKIKVKVKVKQSH
jgi:predicted RecA/RadA family phage recombinase